MGSTESVPVASDYSVAHKVDPSIPHLGGFPPSPNQKTELVVREKLFSWSGDTFNIKTKDGASFNGIKIQGKAFAFRDQMTLLDAQGAPIAVCLRKFEFIRQTFKIYTLKPLFQGQRKSDRDYNGKALYTYAKVVRVPFSTQQDVIFDNRESASFTIHRAGGYWPKKRVVRRQGVTAAMIEGGTWDGAWNSYLLTVNPGIDPCLIVCLTAICDEMDEDG
jgi:LURP-one-related